MTDESGLVGLLHRADWTRLSLSALVNDGSTVLIAPGKRYRFQTADYVTGCDGGSPWLSLDEEDDDDDRYLIGSSEPPLRRLICPAWLLAAARLEVRGRVRVCGRDALDVVALPRPDRRVRLATLDPLTGSAEVAVDAETGILLRVAEPGRKGQRDVTELVSAEFDPDIDPALFRAPPASLREESLGEALGVGGLVWRVAKTAAGLAAGGLGAWIRYGPERQAPIPETTGVEAVGPANPALDPAPRVSADGRPAGPRVADELLNLLHAGGPGGFTATMHQWTDVGGLASAVPPSARRTGFGGLGYLMDAISESAGAFRQTSVVRVAGPMRYQVDRSYQPKNGPVTIACDGEHRWQVYDDKVTKGRPEPPPHEVCELADSSWLLQCWLAGGESVVAGGRPAYRLDVARRPGPRAMWPMALTFSAAVAVVDRELGLILRLTSYVGVKVVLRLELQNIAAAPADFSVDLPDGLPVTEAGPFDDIRSRRRG